MATRAKFKDSKIPTFEELLEYGPEDTYVNIFIYIFEDVITDEKRKKEFLSNVLELLEYLRGQNLKWAQIQVNIYDEEFFKDKDIEYLKRDTVLSYRLSKP
jgi:NDP-sugar pyrophosphorylase family protein